MNPEKYQLLGRCGLFCGIDCEIYAAAHSQDSDLKKRVAETLEQELGIPLNPSDLWCEGCQGPEEHMWFECRLCLIRRCGKEQGLRICLECEKYPCRVLKVWLSVSESAPKNIPEISKIGVDKWVEKKIQDI